MQQSNMWFIKIQKNQIKLSIYFEITILFYYYDIKINNKTLCNFKFWLIWGITRLKSLHGSKVTPIKKKNHVCTQNLTFTAILICQQFQIHLPCIFINHWGEAACCPGSQLVPIFHLPLNGVPKFAAVFKLLKTAESFNNGLSQFDYFKKLRQVLTMVWASYDYFKKLRQVLKMIWASSDFFKKLRHVLKMVWASSDYFKKLGQVLRMGWVSQFWLF